MFDDITSRSPLRSHSPVSWYFLVIVDITPTWFYQRKLERQSTQRLVFNKFILHRNTLDQKNIIRGDPEYKLIILSWRMYLGWKINYCFWIINTTFSTIKDPLWKNKYEHSFVHVDINISINFLSRIPITRLDIKIS